MLARILIPLVYIIILQPHWFPYRLPLTTVYVGT